MLQALEAACRGGVAAQRLLGGLEGEGLLGNIDSIRKFSEFLLLSVNELCIRAGSTDKNLGQR